MNKMRWIKEYLIGLKFNRLHGRLNPNHVEHFIRNALDSAYTKGHENGYWTARLAGAGLNEDGTPWRPSE